MEPVAPFSFYFNSPLHRTYFALLCALCVTLLEERVCVLNVDLADTVLVYGYYTVTGLDCGFTKLWKYVHSSLGTISNETRTDTNIVPKWHKCAGATETQLMVRLKFNSN